MISRPRTSSAGNGQQTARMCRRSWEALAVLSLISMASGLCFAQDNYEIQIYGSELVAPKQTMFELHSNYTFNGTTQTEEGEIPTQDALHETVEITHGWTDYFETGFYIFTSYNPHYGYGWAGDHIRPRFSIPKKWHWPVGLSISNEIGYSPAKYSPDTWTWEIRPIIDKQMGRFYWSFNPVFDRAFHGPDVHQGLVFSPQGTATYDITKFVNVGVEYYTSLGPVFGFDSFAEQSHQIFAVINLNFSPQWEFNFGPGWGLTSVGDHQDRFILKMIIGRRFDWGGLFPGWLR
ncbi:MAG: hypothetical protein ACRD2O_04430 [Terriglobia bacterium]